MSFSSYGTSNDNWGPFDLPKTFNYEFVSYYHKNKATLLSKIKNYDFALKEFEGICDYLTENSFDCSNIIEQITNLNLKLKKRDILRLSLISDYEIYLNSPSIKNFEGLINSLENFKDKSIDTEEYSNIINYLISHELKNIKSNEKDSSKIKNLLNLILSFDPLKYLVEVSRIKSENEKTFFIFDLDSTLFDNSPRVHRIIKDFILDHDDIYPDETKKISNIKRSDIVWGIKQNIMKIGVDNEKFISDVIKYWYIRFFSNEYIIDIPLKGAVDFIKDLEKTGTQIVYLTGRFESMREGTERNILEHNFPLEKDSSNLVLKPEEKIPDHVFKHSAMEEMKKFGTLIAGFDNEPINVNIFKEHFPYAEIFFVETNHSPNPPNLTTDIHTIYNFSYKN